MHILFSPFVPELSPVLYSPLTENKGTLQLKSRGQTNDLKFMQSGEIVENELQRIILKSWIEKCFVCKHYILFLTFLTFLVFFNHFTCKVAQKIKINTIACENNSDPLLWQRAVTNGLRKWQSGLSKHSGLEYELGFSLVLLQD
jgi:hypothetical protein